MKTNMHLLSNLSLILCLMLSVLPLAQGEEGSDSYAIEKLVIGSTNQVEDININDNTFTTYLETLLTKSLIKVDQSGNFVPALAESWETDDAEVWKVRADILYELSRFSEALESVNKGLALKKNDRDMIRLKGKIQNKMKG